MADADLNARVKEALERTEIMALSTIGPDGSWTSPVQFRYNEKLELSFVSMSDTKHAQNILEDPRVSVAIYSFPGPEGGNLGLQIKGKKRKGGGLASPLSPPRLSLAVQSPTRLAVPRGAKPADTNLLGWVWTNVNLLPSGAMN
jgi:Pyridoxamine 5'-phosphate oxidase